MNQPSAWALSRAREVLPCCGTYEGLDGRERPCARGIHSGVDLDDCYRCKLHPAIALALDEARREAGRLAVNEAMHNLRGTIEEARRGARREALEEAAAIVQECGAGGDGRRSRYAMMMEAAARIRALG